MGRRSAVVAERLGEARACEQLSRKRETRRLRAWPCIDGARTRARARSHPERQRADGEGDGHADDDRLLRRHPCGAD
eukprot:3067383-Prymnesium_polylepis.1